MSTVDPTPKPTAGTGPTPPGAGEVPSADAQEQGQPVDGWRDDAEGVEPAASPSPVDDRPEADAAEQEQLVSAKQVRTPTPRPADAAEADWLDQSMAEPLDEDDR